MPFERPSFYTRFTCAKCGRLQRVYLGDPEDCTRPDVEAVRCYECGAVELCGEVDDLVSYHSLYDPVTDEPLEITPALIEEHAYIQTGEPLT